MSDIKFSCPKCGQHLAGSEEHAGLRIACPACGTELVVPAALEAGSAPGLPAMPGARPPSPSPVVPKTSRLAIASLVCSVGSFLILPFGFIPGIICGHMAKRRIDSTPGLRERGLAKAGLIVGYSALGLTVVVVGVVLAGFMFFATHMSRSESGARAQRSVIIAPTPNRRASNAETSDTQSEGSGWTMDLAGVAIPAAALTGRIHGQAFKLKTATLQSGRVKLREDGGSFGGPEMDIVVSCNDLTKLSGRSFTVTQEKRSNNPLIEMKWMEDGGRLPRELSRTIMRCGWSSANAPVMGCLGSSTCACRTRQRVS